MGRMGDFNKERCYISRRATYRGIGIKVVYGVGRGGSVETGGRIYQNGPGGSFCFYLFIRKDQVPDGAWEAMKSGVQYGKWGWQGYYETSLAELRWHYGMTFYNLVETTSGSPDYIEAGCDYNHADDDESGSWESVLFDAKDCVDSLHEMIPGILDVTMAPEGKETP